MKGLPLKLKGRLYSAFVHSVLLYKCEVWTINETEMKALVGRNEYLMRRLVGEEEVQRYRGVKAGRPRPSTSSGGGGAVPGTEAKQGYGLGWGVPSGH